MACASGSSPLTRGKRRAVAGMQGRTRLIPAHAGKTVKMLTMRSATGAHPRSRGENRGLVLSVGGEAGSSPLTRGKRVNLDSGPAPCGLIPAHAGKTRLVDGSARPVPAHPRSRGENQPPWLFHRWQRGSSPLTRGKRRSSQGTGDSGRLIPAHAGKTSTTWPWTPTARAHPRSRGEN